MVLVNGPQLLLQLEKKINYKLKKYTSTFFGLLYSAFTYYTGFKVNSGEYKLMGLAPYGKPIFEKKIKDNLRY